MGVELVPVRSSEPRPEVGWWDLIIPTADYALKVEELGVTKTTYISEELIRGRKAGTFGVFVWTVLTENASEQGLIKPVLNKIRLYSRELREEMAELGIEAHTVMVRFERETALEDHLKRNKISYSR